VEGDAPGAHDDEDPDFLGDLEELGEVVVLCEPKRGRVRGGEAPMPCKGMSQRGERWGKGSGGTVGGQSVEARCLESRMQGLECA
jgi:hypothetical protein